jgi:hypothetical protein
MMIISRLSATAALSPERDLSVWPKGNALWTGRTRAKATVPGISDEQIALARGVDLLSWLMRNEPDSIRKCGLNEYCLAEHDSLKISNGKFYWFSRGFGGASALDFLVKVRGVDFVAAVQSLTDGAVLPPYQAMRKDFPPKPAKPLALPPANINNHRVYAYLRRRGIGKDIINRCLKDGTIYESKAHHRCVFVGKDGDKPRFAFERGTIDDYKKDVQGSSKQFSFNLPPDTSEGGYNLAVFESPIDSLAHFEIHRMGQTEWDGYRLSLGGIGSAALTGFLERHPEISSVKLCLDADQAGNDATSRIIHELLKDRRYSQIKIIASPPPLGKDYADCLQLIHEIDTLKTRTDRQQAAFSI